MVIRENYLAKIRPFIGKDIIKVLTGIRRSGKSVLLEQIRDTIKSHLPQLRGFGQSTPVRVQCPARLYI